MASKVVRAVISTAKAPKAVGPYSQAVKAGNMVYVSGQLGLNVETMELVPGGAAKEAEQALTNLGYILEAAESSYDKVVKTTIFLTSMDDYASVNEVYAKFFSTSKPARSAFAAVSLPKGAKFKIDAVALTGDVEEI